MWCATDKKVERRLGCDALLWGGGRESGRERQIESALLLAVWVKFVVLLRNLLLKGGIGDGGAPRIVAFALAAQVPAFDEQAHVRADKFTSVIC